MNEERQKGLQMRKRRVRERDETGNERKKGRGNGSLRRKEREEGKKEL